ncbi:MAG: FAD-binding oxidoreductase [bacterium]
MLKKTDLDIIKSYLEDSSNLSGGSADGVYIPENEQEITEALKECNSKKTPLTTSAGQTGTTGGSIPFGGWVLTTQKLDKIINIDGKNKTATVQPGVTLEAIEKAVKKEYLLYPPDPTEKTATIGGNVATNASGGRGYRFGATRDWIRRLKVILPSGEILNLSRTKPAKRAKVKNSAGYYNQPGMDKIDLFVGSEGTLGIVSEIEIALAPALQETFDIVAFFPSEQLAVDFVSAAKRSISQSLDLSINFFEFFDQNTLQMLKTNYPQIPANAQSAIYIEQEITPDNEATYLDYWAETLEKYQASLDNCWLGTDENKKEELRKFRHAIPEHINELFTKHHLTKLATDIAVPEDKFRDMMDFYNNSPFVIRHSSLFKIKFGHIGENHLHVNLLPKNEEEKHAAKEIVMRFVKKAVSLGGTVSAEHGIGKIKHEYLKEMYGQAGIDSMIKTKTSLDPNLILNRNNIFKP